MAIAYFIPDQAKLLAAQNNAHHNGNSSNNNANNQQPGATATSSTSSGQPTTPAPSTPHNNNFRANITIPLGAATYESGMSSDIGCWELLTQIFCHALRFCNESERPRTAIIQISLELHSDGHGHAATAPPTPGGNGNAQTPQATTPTTLPPHNVATRSVQHTVATAVPTAVLPPETSAPSARFVPRTHKRRSRKN